MSTSIYGRYFHFFRGLNNRLQIPKLLKAALLNWLLLMVLSSPFTVLGQCTVNADIVPALPQYSVLCPGELVTITAEPFGGTPPYTYLWSTGQTTQVIQVPNPGSTGLNYSVTITDDNGCTDSDLAHLKYLEWSADIAPEVGTFCTGETAYISVEIFPFYGGSTYTWSTGSTDPTIYVTTNGTYSVTITNPNMSCPSVSSTINFNSFVAAPPPNPGITGPASLCPGDNGTLVATGGPFATYLWLPLFITETDILPITDPGLYTLFVTNDEGCDGMATFEVLGGGVQPELNSPNPICTGQSTTLEVVNASSYTDFDWSNGGTGPSITASSPGTYTVTVSAGGSCSATASVEVTSSGTNINLSGSTTANSSCTTANGEINLTASPAGNYDFNWSNGETTEDLSGIAEGSYTVTVSEPGGCSATASFAVAENTVLPSATANVTPATCSQLNGSIDLSISPPGSYSFTWSNGTTTEDLTNIAAGTYSVTATSTVTGCSATASATVTSTIIAITLSGNVTDPSNGQNNGAIDITASPADNYTYAWSNGATTEDLTGLGAGNYTVTVSQGDCASVATFVLTQSGGGCPITVNINSSVPTPSVVCPGETITISATVSGGTAPYTYAWSNGETGSSFTVPAPYNQTLVLGVTDDNGCSAITSIHIKINVWTVDINYSQIPTCNEPLALIASTTAEIPGTTYTWSTGQTGFMIEVTSSGTYSVSMTHPDVPCVATATVTVTVGGGNSPVLQVNGPTTLCPGQNATLTVGGGPFDSYLWTDGSTDPTLQITDPGSYSVTVTNAEGCTGTDFIEIQPGGSSPSMNAPPAICPGQSTVVEVTNPGEFTNFQWSNGGNGPSITVSNPGIYTVTVTGTGGCTATGFAEVNSLGSNINVNGVVTPLNSCTSPNGAIDITSSPAGSYGFNWSNGETTEDLTDIAAGNYTVTVSDAGGCSATANFTVANNTALPSATAVATPATCGQNNGSVNLTVSAGGSYNYLWSNGETTEDLANVPPGTYEVVVTNTATGCTTTASATVQDNSITLAVSGTASPNTSCNGSNGIVVTSVSPSGTYSYLWSNGQTTEDLSGLAAGNYSVTVSAGGTCSGSANFMVNEAANLPSLSANVVPAICGNSVGAIDLSVSPAGSYTYAWSNGTSTEDLSNIAPGDYFVTVTSASGCSATESYNVPNNSNSFTLGGTASPVTNCGAANGAVNLSISPSGVYDILWSNGETTEDLSGIAAGSYSVTVSQGGACTASASFTVDNQTVQPILAQSASPASCGQTNGGVDLTASPTGTYTYLWSSGATTEDLNGVASGNYSVTVTAPNGCSATTSATVAENTVSIALSGNATPNSSCTSANGAIDLTASPTGVYSYLWSNGAATEDLTAVAAGNYTVTVSAGGSCSATVSFTVSNNSGAPSLSLVPDAASCGLANGGINLTASPSGVYTYLWSTGGTTEDLSGIAAGTYTVTVSESNGCSATGSVVVLGGPASFTPSAVVTPVSSCTAANGGIDLSVSPTGSYSFLWSNAATTEDLSAIATGTYTVTVSLGTTCSTTASYVVGGGGSAPVVSQMTTPANCGQSNGSIDLSVSPATGNSFVWSNGAATEDLQNIAPGTYAVTCTGANGCTATLGATVANNNTNFSLTATPTASTSCLLANGQVNLSVSPSGNYVFLWSNAATSEDLMGIAAGTYTVTVTDASSCSDVASTTVGGPTAPLVAIGGPAAACIGQSVSLNATAGFANYAWSNGQAGSSGITVSQPATYTVTATDAGGCTATASYVFGNSPQPTAAISGPGTICGGSTEFEVTGGVFPQITWSTGASTPSITISQSGIYSVTVADANGCTATAFQELLIGTSLLPAIVSDVTGCSGSATLNAGTGYASYLWSNGSASQTISVSMAGNYSVTVSDGSGCTGEATITVSLPTPPQVGIAGATSICTGGSSQLSVPANFTQIIWSNGAATPSITVSQPATYGVTVTDANGCTATDQLTLTVGSSLSPDIVTTLEDCNGTSTLDAGSGYASYLWSNGSTLQSIPVIAAGNYTVTVSDGSSCTGTATETYSPPAPPTVQILGASAHCEGDVSVLVASGNYPQYLWSTGETTPQISVTQAGTYTVTASDANGCTASGNWTITALQPSFTTIEQFSCSAQDTGTVQVTLTNQFGCDSVVMTVTLLSDPTTTNLVLEACNGMSISYNGVDILAGDSQEFVFTATNGCDSVVLVEVLSLPAITYEMEATKTCWNASDGSVELTIMGGKEPFSFSLDGGAYGTATDFTGLAAGSHTVAIQDDNGCVLSLEVLVPQTNPSSLVTEDATINCEIGSVVLQPTLLVENPTEVVWTWPDGSHLPVFTADKEGVYTVQVDDGCEVLERDIQVKWDELYYEKDLFYVPNSFSPNGDGINDDFRVFMAPHVDLLSFEFRVFDRWGDEQFVTFDPEVGWDGVYRETARQIDVHVWFVKAKVAVCGSRVVDVFKEGGVTIVK